MRKYVTQMRYALCGQKHITAVPRRKQYISMDLLEITEYNIKI